MSNKNYFSNILIVFGSMTLFSSLADLLAIMIPLHLANSQWVYAVVQDVSERSIMPIFGIIAILAGLLIKNKDSAISLNTERILSAFCFLFSVGLMVLALLFTLTLHPMENQLSDSYKQKNESYKKQVVMSYVQANIGNGKISKSDILNKKIPINKEVKDYLGKMDKNLALEIKAVKIDFFKKNIKTILNLLFFAFAYVFLGITGFNMACKDLKKLSFEKNAK